MSGHNKWSKVKHKKAATDAKKSKIFSEIARQITTEARKSGGDKTAPGMRALIDKARAENMPNDNIDRAIAKGIGITSGTAFEVVYEAYGPGGSALIVEGVTDNKNRTSNEIKHMLTKKGLQLAQPGSAQWAFTKTEDGKLIATTPLSISPEDKTQLNELVNNLEDHDDIERVYTNVS
tara:strand:- start:7039 stop:7572 length:534 start_codon:yes stop_codon:yes gene_type:complete